MAVYLGSNMVDVFGGQPQGGGGGDDTLGKLLDGSIVTLNIPSGITSIKDSKVGNCNDLVSVVVPEGVTSIGSQFAYRCLNLETVELPSTITSIGNYFVGVTGNETAQAITPTIIIKATTPPTVGTNLLAYRSTNLYNIKVPASSVSAYKSASGWSAVKGRISAIPE